ncbi:hypothetical protein MKO06_12910 [Gramella sp. GC03-9]|uniref:Uncharacterized protein n=1 Tax=Christiangramia oceanisediminis TaxID=2920386 RepID=A0A9X2R9G1_9FLAO|nr:hypothetical protein [Gramella oceanisediminis]MCP9200813.1 hypothetical protein [Gramella oceanisediminis]
MTTEELNQAYNYFTQPNIQTYIEAEVAHTSRNRFERDYAEFTGNQPLPVDTNSKPYFVLAPNANKWGIELRIYFTEDEDNIPEFLDALATSNTRPGYEMYDKRINNNELINYLLSRGFTLG